MHTYWGQGTANVRDICGRTPDEVFALLLKVWCPETCAPRMREKWTPEDPTLGQCSVTAFLAQDLFGGQVLGVPLGDGHYHCFNAVDGCAFDLTSEQFAGRALDYAHAEAQSRDVHFAKSEKLARYELLKRLLADAGSRARPDR